MNEQNILILTIILLGGAYIYFRKLNRDKFVKSKAVKKEEIIQSYEDKMQKVLLKYNDDNNKKLEEKKKLLMEINQELKLNIFFDELETKAIIQHLASMNLKA